MKKIFRLFVAATAILIIAAIVSSTSQIDAQSKVQSQGHDPANVRQGTPSATTTDNAPPELPDNTPALTLDKPVMATLDASSAIQFYTFTGKAQDKIKVDLEPVSGDFFVTLTIQTTDLQTILGGTLGANLIGGSLVVKLPQDGTYAVSVLSGSANGTTPPIGSYQLTVSTFTQK